MIPKYRAYLKDIRGLSKAHFGTHYMYDVHIISFELEEVGVWTPSELYFTFEAIELMQWTGLTDKNGKDIYDRDIIAEGSIGEIIWDGKAEVIKQPLAKVVWGRYGWDAEDICNGEVKVLSDNLFPPNVKTGDLYPLYKSDYDGVFLWPDNVEVIGNIYENPEIK